MLLPKFFYTYWYKNYEECVLRLNISVNIFLVMSEWSQTTSMVMTSIKS